MINNVNSGYLPTGSQSDVKTSEAVVEKTTASSVTSPLASNTEAPASTAADVYAAVSKLQDHVQNLQRTLSFSVDERTGRTIIRVYDSETNELIREIPAEESIRIVNNIGTQNTEIFLKGKQA